MGKSLSYSERHRMVVDLVAHTHFSLDQAVVRDIAAWAATLMADSDEAITDMWRKLNDDHR